MKAILTFFIIVNYFTSFGFQIKKQVNNDSTTLTKREVQTLINKQFTNLITGQSSSSIGNFASVDTKDSKLSFAGSLISEKANVLTVKASGGISDGFFSVFNNSQLNTNIELDFRYNIFINKHNSISFENSSYQKYKNDKKKISEDSAKKKLAIDFELKKMELEQSKVKYIKTIEKINKKLDDKAFATPFSEDSLRYEFAKSSLELKLLEETILPSRVQQTLNLNNELSDQVNKNDINLDIRGFSLQWISFGYNVRKNSFKFLDSTLVYKNQVSSKSFISHELNVQYTSYKWNANYLKTSYFGIGLAYNILDNFNDLTPIEIVESNKFTNNQTTRTTSKKYNAYTGEYIENNNSVRLYADYYQFFLRKNPIALHIYPEVNFYKKSTITNLGVGILFPFKDVKAENKSKVNIELYYNILDIFNNANSNIPLLKRNDIGLRFSFPVKFNS
jgi:hypothetical protein